MKAITFLNDLVASLPVLRLLAKVTPLGDFPELAATLKDNDDLLMDLANWLNQEDAPLPGELLGMRFWLLDLHEAYRATYGQNT